MTRWRKLRFNLMTAVLLPGALPACSRSEIPLETRIANALPAQTVHASGETIAVATANADAADDPAIWRNAADPAQSLIVGTDKKAGLYVYGLDGKVRDFTDAGRVNNVDLAEHDGRIIVAASDRNDPLNAHVALYALDKATAKLSPIGRVPSGAGEAYGICLYRDAATLYAFMVIKDGTIRQVALDLTGGTPTGRIVRTMKLGTQSEGCAFDPVSARLYVAEEDVGLWRFDARAGGAVDPVKVAAADGKAIVADAEGVAVADGYVVVSSQGDNAYAVFRLSDEAYVGRFRIAAGTLGATEETDGIEIAAGDFGPAYPDGLMIAQDGANPPRAQNFKLVRWGEIKAALGL
ncbi:phytase [Sphingomonas endolithica]|uniref:phytase n=1 Tax=Sphingomonas endolithica TaxID=2972485 RepID=UPI0021AFC46F|nr:phytase [Sphingomonas sp. ZFBP2030]